MQEGPFRCRCGYVTWGNLKYCPECGGELEKRCKKCGATWRYFYHYAYCPECGVRTGDVGEKLEARR